MTNIPTEKPILIPIGGIGEIGMNFYLYGYKGKWLVVDCGLSFAGDALPGIDLLLPDPTFVSTLAKDIVGLVITHAHEDHFGAVPHLWRNLKCPVYSRRFTLEMLEASLDEAGLLGRVPLHVVDQYDTLDLDPFKVTVVPMTHSVPDA